MASRKQGAIGYVTYGLGRTSGGIGRYTLELLQALAQMGVDITVLQSELERTHAVDVPTIPLRGSRLLPGLLTWGQVEIARARRTADLALIHDPTGSIPLGLAGGLRVSTIHDVVPYIYPQTSSRLDWLVYRFWLPWVVRQMAAVITDSVQSKQDIVRYLRVPETKITVVPCAAGGQYRPLPAAQVAAVVAKYKIEGPYILYVGSIVARKNLIRMIEAYAELRRWSPNWRLVIVGARLWRSTGVYEVVERLGLLDAIQFTGFVDEPDLPALYNGADLFVFPSLYEGFGLPVLEAMACGTPVVTSTASSLPEVTGADGALLVDPYDVAAIAAAIRTVLTDAAVADRLRAAGLARAQTFSWQRTARETVAVYDRLLSS